MTDHQSRIRLPARRLWESAGQPEGRDLEFWCVAERWVVQETTCQERLGGHAIAFTPSAQAPGHAFPGAGAFC